MIVRLDPESAGRAQAVLAYLHRGPDCLPGVIHDAILSGLLSRGARFDAELRQALAEGPAAVAPVEPVAAQLGAALEMGVDVTLPEHPGQGAPAPAAKARELAAALGASEDAVYHAAMLVGLRRLDPSVSFPVATYPGDYDPPVGTARLESL